MLVEVLVQPLVEVQLLPMSLEHEVDLHVQELSIEQPFLVQQLPIQVLSTQLFNLRSLLDLNLANESQADIEDKVRLFIYINSGLDYINRLQFKYRRKMITPS